jgi:hypothetical protein
MLHGEWDHPIDLNGKTVRMIGTRHSVEISTDIQKVRFS